MIEKCLYTHHFFKAVLLTLAIGSFAQAKTTMSVLPSSAPSMKVCVYYDSQPTDPKYRLGEIYAIMASNLLGHFREVTAESLPIRNYKSGDLQKCDRVMYLGSYYNAPTPKEFYQDLSTYKKSVLWTGYNIWNYETFLGKPKFVGQTGFETAGLVGYDTPPTPQNPYPEFYKYFSYKGEQFEKLLRYDSFAKKTFSSPEILMIKAEKKEWVISEAEHSKSKNHTPYVTHKNNFFYFADLPLSFIHESDRYLIFSDVLFDFLNLAPRLTKKYALVRVEDVHAKFDPSLIYRVTNSFRNRQQKNGKIGLPFVISLIPAYVDPFGYFDGKKWDTDFTKNPEVLKAVKYATANGGRIIMHGYTHQLGETINCNSGVSGADFEFWDACNKKPVTGESANWVMDRLNKGLEIIKQAGLQNFGWLTPHYQASPLANRVFANVFSRTIGRYRYMPEPYNPEDQISWAGQFFPYTIEKDFYGNWVWPENLGNINVNILGGTGMNLRTADQILHSAKQNLVIRDAWASFFWHPAPNYEINGLAQSLDKIIDGILSYGYEFVDVKELIEHGE